MLLLNEFPHREWLCPSTRTYKYSIFAKELNKPLQLVHHKKMPIWGDAGATSVLHTRLWRTLRSCPLCFRGCGGFYLSLYVTFTCRGNQVWTFSARLMISDWLTAPVCHVWSNQAKKSMNEVKKYCMKDTTSRLRPWLCMPYVNTFLLSLFEYYIYKSCFTL